MNSCFKTEFCLHTYLCQQYPGKKFTIKPVVLNSPTKDGLFDTPLENPLYAKTNRLFYGNFRNCMCLWSPDGVVMYNVGSDDDNTEKLLMMGAWAVPNEGGYNYGYFIGVQIDFDTPIIDFEPEHPFAPSYKVWLQGILNGEFNDSSISAYISTKVLKIEDFPFFFEAFLEVEGGMNPTGFSIVNGDIGGLSFYLTGENNNRFAIDPPAELPESFTGEITIKNSISNVEYIQEISYVKPI